MYGAPREYYLLKIGLWCLRKIVGFFAYAPQAYLRTDFGRWHFTGTFGVWVIGLQATLMLAIGVFAIAPYQITMAVLRFNPSLDEVRAGVELATPDSLDLRSRAAATLESLKGVKLLDESVSWGSYYGQLAYRLAIEIVTVPFACFVIGFFFLAIWHRRRSEAVARPNDFPGVSRLEDLRLGLTRDEIQGIAEPLLVIAFALLVCWGPIPGSALVVPSLNADRTLGAYLLFAGLAFGVSEQLRLGSERVKRQRREGREREWGGRGSDGTKIDQSFHRVTVEIESPGPAVSVAGAYAALPESLFAVVDALPDDLAADINRLRSGGCNSEQSGSDVPSEGKAKVISTRCDGCGREYRFRRTVSPNKLLRCACGHEWRLRSQMSS